MTQQTVVIGSATDNGVNKLQVTGSSIFTQSTSATPTISITNTGGTSNSIIAQFTGDSDSLRILNIGTGDYAIVNSQQNNGIRFYDDTAGVEILYNGSVDVAFNSTGIDFKRQPTYNGSVFWNANNDGSGSGLDADLLDGIDSLRFLRSDEDDTFNGNLTITGNLTVSGNTTTVNTETILLADNIITLNSNYTGSTPSENAGIEVERGTLTNSSLVWDETNDWWKLISVGTDLGRIITTADEGSGNGFDADTVDGLQAAQFLRSDANDTATGDIIFQGTITVGNNTAAGATIIMDGEAGNRYIFSNNNEIGFLNSAFAYAAYSDGSNNWRVLNDTYAKRFIDSDNNTYLLDPASTSVLNIIDLEGQIRHNGDTDTYLNFNAADSFEVRTGGSQRLTVTNTAVTAINQMRSPIYYDNDDITYYGDFAGNSRLNDITLVGEIIADGDTNTYLDFNAEDSFQVVTGGTARLTVSNTAVTASVNMVAPQFVDSSDNAYYGDFASTSVMNNISLEGNLQHNGDTDTYITFPALNQIGFYTASTERFLITDTYAQSSNDLRAPRFVDSANFNKFADPAGTSEFNSANFYSGAANNSVNIGIGATERFNIDITDGQGFIRYIQDETDTTDHSVNFQIISTSTGLNRFNFNKNIDVGSNSVTGAFGVFSSGVYAPVFYDNDNELFYADFNNTDVSIRVAGEIIAGDGSLTTPTFSFVSDPNTGMYRFAADTIGFSAGGNDEFRIYTTYAQAVGQMRAPIYYDSDNTAYYGDFASSSVMNTIGIDSDLFHNGDTDTKLSFNTDSITLTTANVVRLTANTTALTSSLNTYAPRFYTDDYLVHVGDENTYVGFDANDTFGVWTNGANRLSITTTAITGSVNFVGPRFVDSDNNAYYAEPASSSVFNTLGIDSDLFHNGDTDTKLAFATDSIALNTAGATRLTANNTGVYTTNLYSSGVVDAVTAVYAPIYYDKDNNSYYADFANTGTSIVAAGKIAVGKTSASAMVDVNIATAMGANPYAAGNQYIKLGDASVVDFSIAGDNLRNIWGIIESSAQFVFADSAATILLSMDATAGDVIVGDQTAQYATSDGVPTFVGALDANKLHVNGSVQLNGINNAISIYAADAGNTAISSATFLAVNELGFSGGGGFYMNDTTNIRVKNNKTLTSTGDFQAARFVDVSDTNYFVDPASTSVMNRIGIDDYIQHNGDTDNYFGFAANDTFRVFTGNTQRLNVDNDSADFAVDVYAPRYFDSANSSYYVDPASTSIMSRIDIDDYIRHRGDENNYFGFEANDTFRVFTSGTQRFNVDDNSADFAVDVYAPRYFDSNNNTFVGDFAGTSVFARVTMPQNTVGVSFSGNSNVPDYYIGQTTGDTDAWKIYGESPSGTDTASLIIAVEGDRDANEQIRFRFKNSTTFATTDALVAYHDYVQATTSFRAPIFEDSNNTAFYIDPASISVTNTMRANQFQIDGSTYIIDSPAGEYGSIRVEGAVDGTWAGYAIRDDWVFMADGATNAGIYNDTDNEWAIQFIRNGGTDLLFDGIKQAETENGHFLATNQMRAPIYYAPSSTSYWLDLDVASGTDALRIPSQINRLNFTADSGSTNNFLVAQDQNHFVWTPVTNWGIFWATNSTAAYRHTPFVDNMITFVGAGTVRAAIDLDNGNAYFQGEVTASNFRISGGNEDLGILKTYGSGLADTKMFDGTEYWEKRVIQAMQGVEDSATTVTAEYVKNNNGPFASTYALRTDQYRTFDSDYIPVEPGEQIYGEIAARYISGSGGLVYMGIRRYDKDKLPITSNDGIEYFVVSANNLTDTNWVTFSGHTTIPTTHTPFNGSDGGGCKYVRVIVLMNYPNGTGPALREYGPPVLKRTNHLSNAQFQNVTVNGNASVTGTVTGTQFIDANNNAYYVDPASTSLMNEIHVDEYIRHNGDTDSFLRFIGEDDVQLVAGGRQMLRMTEGTDPDRLRFVTDTNWTDSDGDWNMSRDITVGRTGTAVTDFRAPIFYDSANTTFYGDFASTSQLNQLILTNAEPLRFTTTSTALFDYEGASLNVPFNMQNTGGTVSDGSADGVLQLTRINHNNASTTAGAGLYFQLKDSAGTLREYAGIYGRKTVAGIGGGELVFMNYARNELAYLNSGFFRHTTDVRAPLFSDSNDTAFFMDPASTSVTNIVRANQLQLDGSTYLIDTASGDYGSIQVSGNKNGWAGYSINGQWNFMSSGPGNAGIYNDTDNEWAILAAQNSDVQIYFDGTWEERSRSGYMEARGAYYAPIFYDSDNTTYRIDGNGTSRLLTLNVDNVIGGSVNGYSTTLLFTDNRTISPSEDPAGRMRFGFTSWNNNNTSPYADYLHLRSYTDATGGSDNLVMFRKDAIGMRIWQQTWGSATAYATVRNVAIYNENPGASNDLYASIFYDSNDTAFRVDPNSVSTIRQMRVAAPVQAADYLNAAIEVREFNYGGAQTDVYATAPRIAFHWSGRVASQIAMASDGEIRILNNPGTATEAFRASNITAESALYSQIFYDSNNTARFVDPASTSQMNQIVINGQSTMATQPALVASNFGHGIYGLYDPTRYQHVWSMGTAYNLPADGLSTGATAGNLYGLAWAFNPNHSVAGTNVQAKAGLNHQLLLIQNGTTTFAAGSGMWTSGIATSTNSFRAPIFYDTDDTAFYFNGATLNDTRFEGVNARTKAMMGLSGQTRSSAELYSARPRNTADQNYWTGAMGWSTVDMNTVADWGCGFIDSSGNPGNQPAGTSHWVGVQALHFTDGSTRYGWQMVGGPIGNLRFRNTWPSFQAWRTIPVLDINNNNGGAMYAGIYYDSDDTAFYCDPTGFTNLNTGVRATDFYARDWFRNDNAGEGHYNQATGVHSYSRNANEWRLAGNNSANAMNLRGLANYDAVSRFWIHGATDGYQGFLNDAGQWVLRITHADGFSPGIRFQEEANETWTGNPGSDVGKIEYHANRFYIASGANSDRIVQFRRDGTDVSFIGNDGVFNGTATSARYADLAERYEADAIYEAGVVLGIGGDKEVTLYQPGMPLAGAVSVKPGYRMNDKDYGNDNSIEAKMNPFVALKGRIPVKINGSAKKGQWIVADKDGKGRAVDYGSDVNKHEIIGVAIGNGEGEVEVKI